MVAEVQDIFLRKRNTTAQYKEKKEEAGETKKKKRQPAKNGEEIFNGDENFSRTGMANKCGHGGLRRQCMAVPAQLFYRHRALPY